MSLFIQNTKVCLNEDKQPYVVENIFYLPNGLLNVDYKLIEQTNIEYNNIQHFLQHYKKFNRNSEKFLNKLISIQKQKIISANQLLESPENNLGYNRLIPPYNAPCYHSNNGCIKKAAFKNSSTAVLYCWFHVNCQNNI